MSEAPASIETVLSTLDQARAAIDTARDAVVRGHSEAEAPKSAKQIIADVAARREITVRQLVGPLRKKQFVRARDEAAWLMRKLPAGLSYPQIAQILGNRDHTTIITAVRRHQARVDGP